VRDPLKNQKWNRICKKERYHPPRIAGKINVSGGVGRLQRGVVHHVLLGEDPAAGVQQDSVQEVFKTVGIDKTCKHSHEETSYGNRGMRENPYGDK
jgi:hypothetical protein